MYSALFKTIALYWRDNGGFKEFISSPFLHASAAIALLYAFNVVSIDWRSVTLSSLPTMLGFSLAAYTITFTLMGSALHRALSAAIDKKSGTPLIKIVNATFFHIVLFQTISLTYALVTKGDFFWRTFGEGPGISELSHITAVVIVYGGDTVGCFLTVYAILLLFSVSFAMFRLGRLATLPSTAVRSGERDNGEQKPTVAQTKPIRFGIVKVIARVLRIY